MCRNERHIKPFSLIPTMTDGYGNAQDLQTYETKGLKAHASSWRSPHTAGGEFRPALRTRPTCQFG